MNLENSGRISARRRIVLGCFLVTMSAVGVAALAGCRSKVKVGSSAGRDVDRGGSDAPPALSFREVLTRGNDLNACREALRLVNNGMHAEGASQIPTLDAQHRAQYEDKELLGLGPDEVKEIEGERFTLLDGRHLDACFLFHDAAAGQNLVDQKKLSALQKAQIAFDWVMREVILIGQQGGPTPVPPEFALRAGKGNGLERSLVFLALLEQIGCEGCLLNFPHEKEAGQRTGGRLLCGVLAEDGAKSSIYLFDPQMALPLPGPEGKGIATLQSIQQQEHLLAPLGVTKDDIYKVTPSEVVLYASLSTLAPRNRYLQEVLEEAGTRVRIADPDLKEKKARFESAVSQEALSPAPAVHCLPFLSTMLRRFLPPTEGGSDDIKDPNRQGVRLGNLPGYAPKRLGDLSVGISLLQQHLVTQVSWEQFPEALRDLDYRSELGQSVRSAYLNLFMPYLGGVPKQGRDLLLRGQLGEVIAQLARDREELPDLKARLEFPPSKPFEETMMAVREGKQSRKDLINRELPGRAAVLCEQAEKKWSEVLSAEQDKDATRAAEARTELNLAVARAAELWLPYLQAMTAEPRTMLANYQIALCRHEQAERLQARLSRSGEAPSAAEKEKVRNAWSAAGDSWYRFINEYPHAVLASCSRRQYARVLRVQGNTEQAARWLMEDSDDLSMTPNERAAREYLAKQLKK